MLAPVALAALLVAGSAALVGPIRPSLVTVPPEPGVQVLADAPTLQAVAVDLDRDGVREVVALTEAPDGGLRLGAWAESDGAWGELAAPLPVDPVAAEGAVGEDGVGSGPMRLVVRRDVLGERLTLVRQPAWLPPGAGVPCCLQLDDVVLEGADLSLRSVAERIDAVDSVHVIDLDGDGSDELLAARSLPPLGDITYPTEMVTFRWAGDRFDMPILQELPVGSGDTPFLLGDSDGLPGEELGIIATAGRPAFYRIGLGPDGLRVEESGLVPLPVEATAVPMTTGRGIAMLTGGGVLETRPWPAGEAIGEPVGHTTGLTGARLLASVRAGDERYLVVRQAVGVELLHLLLLPELRPIVSGAPRGGAAPPFSRVAPVVSYVGTLPGGGPDGEAAVLAAGRFVRATDGTPASIWSRSALFAGAAPAGLAGRDRAWLAIHHLPMGRPVDVAGGRLDPPAPLVGSGLTVAPVALVEEGEIDDASLAPAVGGRVVIAPDGSLLVGSSGFIARVEAPPGSRVYTSGLDPTVVASVTVVDGSGRADVRMPPPTTGATDPRYRASLSVTTPAGHAYLATWTVRVLTRPPALDATVRTPFGSSEVEIGGTTAPDAEVRVADRVAPVDAQGRFVATVGVPPWPTEVVITATDPLGNEARQVVTAIGFLDVRQLPWLPILGAGLFAMALLFFLRAPRARSRPSVAIDEGGVVLEELDEDG